MIKPVYFGKSKGDKGLLDYVNGLNNFNFSDWVKEKIKEKMGNPKTNDINNVNVNTKEIETLIRMILKEDGFVDRGEESRGEEGEVKGSKTVDVEVKEDVSLNGWIL